MSARFWLGTLYDWTPCESLPETCTWLKGQQEVCPSTGRTHHQVIAGFARQVRLAHVKRVVGVGHWEATRSSAADAYVHKDDTAVVGTRFEFGAKAFRRNCPTDWEKVRDSAKSGDFDSIPADIFVRHYFALQRIAADNSQPLAMERSCAVFWGATGTGKSRLAWEQAGLSAYVKDPRTKWWCGYQGQGHVVIDEFRGSIDIAHLLRWLDRYPVLVEVKGGSRPLCAVKFWITSNVDPRQWYPDVDEETKLALLRRLNITHFN